MFFGSDNTGPAHPAALEALLRANTGHAASYGEDALTAQVQDRIRTLFEAPDAAVYLVPTGTAANALALACLSNPWETVFCTAMAHINVDECGAPEFFTGGAKLTLIDAPDGKMTPEALTTAIAGEENRGVHGVQRGPVSLTQATEAGTIYTVDEVTALSAVARAHNLPVHMDGARFANALVRLGCSPAELSWKAGVDVLCFGGTKNGLLGVEAVILFDPARAWEFELRRKRAAHLFSKHRYLAAQMDAYLEGDLWHDLATKANAACDYLLNGLIASGQAEICFPIEANMIFARWPRALHQRLFDAGAAYSLWSGSLTGDDPAEPLMARLVCDWSATSADADRFLANLQR
ncbi:low specificity L-threonine aldolase [Pseudoruegeria sp. SK021]|uniref:threonine aldolase family protein n=1 Tax=Pseudoruegeria sp. SK021 TaxID=1933035 RepID=UPI000A239854|nr:beta-eliminating lyase-related protein [Pseudoruegeria sp. SK021]OSP54160.1 low specificity L-threonine aldolase [Pseudoruegeria sp. SK021]